jgi:hypothetical protein
MAKSTGTNFGANLILTAFGTTFLAPIQYGNEADFIPWSTVEYQQLTSNSWDDVVTFSSNPIDPKMNSLKAFSENLLRNSSDMDLEIMEVVNDAYWDLL